MQIASRACFPLSVRRRDHEQPKYSTPPPPPHGFHSQKHSPSTLHFLPELTQAENKQIYIPTLSIRQDSEQPVKIDKKHS